MIKVVIDSRMLTWTGAGAYIRNLLKYIDYERFEFNQPIYGLREQIFFPYRALRKLKPDILHFPHCNIPWFYRGKIIVTIHDLTHLIYPEFLPHKKYKRISRLVYFYFYFLNWFACKRAKHIIADSESTKKDIMKIFKVKADKISVIYLGVDEEFIIKEKAEVNYLHKKYSIPEDKKILLYVGNLTPHKNVETLIKAFAKIKNKEDFVLVLVGKAFDQFKASDDKNIISTGFIEKNELVDFYNLADLFVFPSIYEGFGLPVLEALACGCKVACSGVSSLPEVGGDAAVYFNPKDADDIAEKIEEAMNLNRTKESLRNYALQFSWKKTAEQTLDVFKNFS